MIKNTKYILLISISLFAQLAVAGSEKTGNPERKRSSNEAMTELVYKKFVKLQEMIADEKYSEARVGLNALTNKRLNGFETAQINQFLAWVDSAESKYTSALKYLQVAINADALPNQALFSMMLQRAQMLGGEGKHQQSIDALKQYYKIVDEIRDSTFYFEAQIYAQMDKFRPALAALKKAISLADKPNEPWYYLRFNLHMQLSEFKQAAETLEILIKINPNKKDYWIKLSQVYFTLKKDEKALGVLVVADKNGMITNEKEKLQLFKMYAFLGVPYKAGNVLEKALKNGIVKPTFKRWDELGKIWYSAAEMENALNAYDEASKLATDGKIDFQRAYIYFEREEWRKSRTALLAAIEKGGLKDKQVGNAWLLLGMVESELNNSKGAVSALRKAAKHKGTRKNALQWIDHIEKEAIRARAEAVAQKAIDDERAANAIIDQ